MDGIESPYYKSVPPTHQLSKRLRQILGRNRELPGGSEVGARSRGSCKDAPVPSTGSGKRPSASGAPTFAATRGVRLQDPQKLARPPRIMAAAERAQILASLEQTGWHIRGPVGAAKLLGLTPTPHESRLKKLGLEHPRGASPPSDQSEPLRDIG